MNISFLKSISLGFGLFLGAASGTLLIKVLSLILQVVLVRVTQA